MEVDGIEPADHNVVDAGHGGGTLIEDVELQDVSTGRLGELATGETRDEVRTFASLPLRKRGVARRGNGLSAYTGVILAEAGLRVPRALLTPEGKAMI